MGSRYGRHRVTYLGGFPFETYSGGRPSQVVVRIIIGTTIEKNLHELPSTQDKKHNGVQRLLLFFVLDGILVIRFTYNSRLQVQLCPAAIIAHPHRQRRNSRLLTLKIRVS